MVTPSKYFDELHMSSPKRKYCRISIRRYSVWGNSSIPCGRSIQMINHRCNGGMMFLITCLALSEVFRQVSFFLIPPDNSAVGCFVQPKWTSIVLMCYSYRFFVSASDSKQQWLVQWHRRRRRRRQCGIRDTAAFPMAPLRIRRILPKRRSSTTDNNETWTAMANELAHGVECWLAELYVCRQTNERL